MYTFTHVTRFTTKGSDGKDIANSVSEQLTVPETIDDLRDLATQDSGLEKVEITVGDDATKKTLTVPAVVADYIRGRKLRSNQEMQAANKDGGKIAARAKTAAWYVGKEPNNGGDFLQRLMANNTPAKIKEHNAWLDGLYTANRAEIDG